MTSETSSGLIEALLRASWIANVPNSLARKDESLPQKDPKFDKKKLVNNLGNFSLILAFGIENLFYQ